MVTSLITAAIAAATTTGVCLWAYRKGKADGISAAYKEKSNFSSDLISMVAISSLMGFGSNKGFTPSYYAPKDEELDKLFNALKDNHSSCACKQQEESSQS